MTVILTVIVKAFSVISVLLVFSSWALAEEPYWGAYARLLDRHVSQKTREGISLAWLNYPVIRHDPDYQTVLDRLREFPLERLTGRQEKLAFYINAYNILAIKIILDHWPLKSIRDVGNWFSPVWKKEAGKIGGRVGVKTVTLHEIEHEILRPMGEPRIHMAIVCASLSCPDLRKEPFVALRLEHQLEDQTVRFLKNASKGLCRSGETLRISKIFDWFAEDFGDRVAFIRRYRSDLSDSEQIVIKGFLPYNWSLNGSSQ